MGKFMQPSSKGFRNPTDTAQENGAIINPPRTSRLGGFDKLSDGVSKNGIVLKKPGQTIVK